MLNPCRHNPLAMAISAPTNQGNRIPDLHELTHLQALADEERTVLARHDSLIESRAAEMARAKSTLDAFKKAHQVSIQFKDALVHVLEAAQPLLDATRNQITVHAPAPLMPEFRGPKWMTNLHHHTAKLQRDIQTYQSLSLPLIKHERSFIDEITAVESIVSAHESTLAALQNSRKLFQVSLDSKRRFMLNPVRRLPLDVLFVLFLSVLDSELVGLRFRFTQSHVSEPPRTPIRLASVCSRWRSAAISMPLLWRYVTLYSPRFTQSDYRFHFETWVGRAKMVSLELTVPYPGAGFGWEVRKILKSFQETRPRIGRLNILFLDDRFGVESLLVQLPCPGELFLFSHSGGRPGVFIPHSFSALKGLEVHDVWPLIDKSFDSLHSVRIKAERSCSRVDFKECKTLLRNTPALNTFEISIEIAPYGPPNTSQTPLKLTSVTISPENLHTLSGHFSFPSLDTLIMSGPDLDYDVWNQVLEDSGLSETLIYLEVPPKWLAFDGKGRNSRSDGLDSNGPDSSGPDSDGPDSDGCNSDGRDKKDHGYELLRTLDNLEQLKVYEPSAAVVFSSLRNLEQERLIAPRLAKVIVGGADEVLVESLCEMCEYRNGSNLAQQGILVKISKVELRRKEHLSLAVQGRLERALEG
jgi:hypothetical protein